MNYIPRTPYVPGGTPSVVPERVKKKKIVHVFSILGWVVFSVAIHGFVGTYLYKNEFATKKLFDAKSELKRVSDEAQEDDKRSLEVVKTYSQKMQIAEKLIANHLAPSKLLTHIESFTKKTVQYETFTYKYDPGFNASVRLDGITDTLKSAFVQKQGYGAAQLFGTYEVSGVALQSGEVGDDGKVIREDAVIFSFEGILKPDAIKYTAPATSTTNGVTLDLKDVLVVESTTSSSSATSTQSEGTQDTGPDSETMETTS